MAIINITSTPDTTATEGSLYSYNPLTDGTPIRWDITGAPSGMTLDYTSGVISWTPSYDRTNSGSLHLDTRDASDNTGSQDWTIAVTFVAPIINSSPTTTATEGSLYSYLPDSTVVNIDHWDTTGAPTGMTVDSSTGYIQWTPAYDQTNSGSVRLNVRALNGLNTYQDWTIAVTQVAPIINNSPTTTATEGSLYSYLPDSTVVDLYRWDMTGAPSGMTTDSSTGYIQWTPSYDRTNSGALTLTVRSLNGLTAQKDWTIAVTFVAPIINNSPTTTATEGSLYSYLPDSTVVNIDHWDTTGAPTGMTVDSSTGYIQWTPAYDQTNSGSVRLNVRSLNGLNAYKDWTVAVTQVAPIINNSPTTTATENALYSYLPDSTVVNLYRWDMTGAPSGMTTDSSTGLVRWTPSYDRTNSGDLTLTVRSLNGLTAHKDWTVAVTMIAPIISNSPTTTATEDILYTFLPDATVVALDHWDTTGAPTGMTVDSSTGYIQWTPNYDQSNSGSVRLNVRSLNGLNAYKDWTVAVTFVAPIISNSPPVVASENVLYTFLPDATVVHLDHWDTTGAPTGMTVDSTTGYIQWTPAPDQTNSGSVRLVVRSLNGLSDYVDWTIAVTPFAITNQPISQDTTFGHSTLFGLDATATETITYQWYHDGTLILGATDATYPINGAYFAQAGNYVCRIRAQGTYEDSTTVTLTVAEDPLPADQIKQKGNNMVAPGLADIAQASGGTYNPGIGWILDPKTNLPVGNKVFLEF